MAIQEIRLYYKIAEEERHDINEKEDQENRLTTSILDKMVASPWPMLLAVLQNSRN